MYIANIELLKRTLISLQNDPSAETILLFMCDRNKPNMDEILNILSNNHKPLMGGVFPELIADGERKLEGFLLLSLSEKWEIFSIHDENESSIGMQLKENIEKSNIQIESVFCFVNALWKQKSTFINELYNHFGPFVQYLGGGAGSLSFESFPCVFANQNVIERGAVIGINSNIISMGVSHGWHPISEPIKVTKSSGNQIVSLNWLPAFEVYKSFVEGHKVPLIDKNNFFEIAKSYPLGMVRLDNEMIIRDPFATSDGILHVVDEVPEGEYVRIMHGNMESLLEGAKNAAMISSAEATENSIRFCIDCISRVLYMDTDFVKELEHLNKNQLIDGVLSIGEIANPKSASLELYNKTVVVAQWKKKI
jgi:hypothetical protein